jgi:hypothetical protein
LNGISLLEDFLNGPSVGSWEVAIRRETVPIGKNTIIAISITGDKNKNPLLIKVKLER